MSTLDVDAAYRRWFPIIRAKCARMTRSDSIAQDLAQETFTRLWSNRFELERPEAVMPWVYRTATRLAIDLHRRDRRIASGVAGVAVAETAAPAGQRPDRTLEARDLLRRLAHWMPERELEALVLHRVDQMTQPEIAAVLGASERTVRRLLQRAEARLDSLEGRAA